jgi:CRISPR system Cascade subunit CasB
MNAPAPAGGSLTKRRQHPLSRHVSATVNALQGAYLSDRQSVSGPAAGNLAVLRRSISAAPGATPEVWQLLFDNWPAELAPRKGEEEATPAELAAHAALTLYAVHQQSQRQLKMHRTGYSMGRSAGLLARPLGDDEQIRVRRRFNALATASSLPETLHHSRGLITQFRGTDIPLDYGRLAVDLYHLQNPGRADRVRLQWGRDYYARAPKTETDSSTQSEEQTP